MTTHDTASLATIMREAALAATAIPVRAQHQIPPKPFHAPGQWFPTELLGHPMREYAPGKWECATWPSEQPEVQGAWKLAILSKLREALGTDGTLYRAVEAMLAAAPAARDGEGGKPSACVSVASLPAELLALADGLDRLRYPDNAALVREAAAALASHAGEGGLHRIRTYVEQAPYDFGIGASKVPGSFDRNFSIREDLLCVIDREIERTPEQPEGKGAVRLAGFTQYHLDNWTDDDFKQHIPAVREALAEALAAALRQEESK